MLCKTAPEAHGENNTGESSAFAKLCTRHDNAEGAGAAAQAPPTPGCLSERVGCRETQGHSQPLLLKAETINPRAECITHTHVNT